MSAPSTEAARATAESPAQQQGPRVPMRWPLPAIAVIVMLVVVTREAARPISDPDAWWHLRVGKLFWNGTFTFWDTGPLSTFATEAWTPRDILPQLAASKVEQLFGLPGVAWLYGASLVTFLVIAYVVCRRHGSPLPAALATGLCLIGAAPSLSQRPQMVSFILLLIFMGAWMRSASDLKTRWWLVPLTWIWAMSHGLWYVGIALGVGICAGLLLDHRLDRRAAVKLVAVPMLGVAVAGLTPAGPSLIVSAFQTTDKWQFVTEWASPDFKSVAPAAAMLMICVVAVTWARRRTSTPWAHVSILLMGTGLVLLTARTVAPGAIMLAPLVALALNESLYPHSVATAPSAREGAAVLLPAVACLIVLGMITSTTAALPGSVPTGMHDELADLPDGTAVLNEYRLGGWLHWGYPELNTVIDGFTDGYTVEALASYGEARAAAPGWQDYIEETGPDVALLGEDSPLGDALVDHLDWSVVARDAGYVLLRRP